MRIVEPRHMEFDLKRLCEALQKITIGILPTTRPNTAFLMVMDVVF